MRKIAFFIFLLLFVGCSHLHREYCITAEWPCKPLSLYESEQPKNNDIIGWNSTQEDYFCYQEIKCNDIDWWWED